MRELVENSVVKESFTVQIDCKRSADIATAEALTKEVPVRQAGWITRPPLREMDKMLSGLFKKIMA